MGQAAFDVDYDPVNRILEITMTGFWTSETFKEFSQAVAERSRTIDGECHHLVDNSELQVRSPEVMEAMRDNADREFDPTRRSKVAIVAKSALLKMQDDRMGVRGDRVRYFTDRDEARAWLKSFPL